MASLFLLLPESRLSYSWMRSNQEIQSEPALNQCIQNLTIILNETDIENYIGYYDRMNVENFLEDFDTLEDYYPYPARTRLRYVLNSFYDWRDTMVQQVDKSYLLFNQPLANHTFCEIAQRKRNDTDENFLLINHDAHMLISPITIFFDYDNTSFESISTSDEAADWFAHNRQPERDFHAIEKHGENRQESRMSKRGVISPLKSSSQEAKHILKTALGKTKKELFGYDVVRNEFIVYKYEGETGQNLYHGYHQPLDSNEIPDEIKEKLLANNTRRNRNH